MSSHDAPDKDTPEKDDQAAQSASGHDAAPLRSTFADDPDLQKVLQHFVDSLPPMVAQIADAFDRGALEDLRRLVHQVKGAGGGYGFAPISDRAASAEQRLRAGQSLEQVTSDVQALLGLIRQVEGYNRSREQVR
jgi:HPt (histidine-containing phosphotransfer) domain-containing protein